MLLSIIVPSFERPELLKRLARTARDMPDDVEILVGVDGGGYDPCIYDPLVVSNLPKLGRFEVMRRLVSTSQARYVMISDDDDFFLPQQLQVLRQELHTFDVHRHADEIGIVFNCDYLNKARSTRERFLPRSMDILHPLTKWRIKHDFKQVVDAKVLQRAFSQIPESPDRVPTSLVWLYCGDFGRVAYRPVAVMVKDYQQAGLSSTVKSGRPRGGTLYRKFYSEALRRTVARDFGILFAIKCIYSYLNSYRKFSA